MGDGVVGRIVQDAWHVVLVWADVFGIAVEDFTNSIDTAGGLQEGFPEAGVDVLGSVDSQAVDGVVLHELRDPGVENGLDCCIFCP